MTRSLDEQLGRLVARWVATVLRRPRLVAVGLIVASLLAAPLVVTSLGLDSDEETLFGDDADFARTRDDFRRAFPALVDPIVVVIDGSAPGVAEDAAERLTARLAEEPETFPSVTRPDGGTFFERNGLLYLDRDELADLLDRLAGAQPYLAALGRDPTLRGLFDLMTAAADAAGRGEYEVLELDSAFRAVRETLAQTARGHAQPLDWRELIQGPGAEDFDRRKLLLVEPTLDFQSLGPAGASLARLRQHAREVQDLDHGGLRIRLTGAFALSQEEASLVASQAGAAGLAAFALVLGVLVVGLRSARAVAAVIVTLLAGLLWTAGFAALAVGHLNLLSVAFAVLFIGLSVDFAIHLCVRASELSADASLDAALVSASRDVGGSLVICALTTAIGFYAFLATDFVGVAELGLIAGTGMLIGLAANLTLLPALLVQWRPRFAARGSAGPRMASGFLAGLPLNHPKAVLLATALVTGAAALLVPRAHFDANPLRVRDPSATSVQAFDDLLADGRAHPWNLNALAADPDEARRLATRLAALDSVEEAIGPEDFVPDDQDEKLAWIGELAFILLPSLEPHRREPPPTSAEVRDSMASLRKATLELTKRRVPDSLAHASRELGAALVSFEDRIRSDPTPERTLEQLEHALLGSLPYELDRLRRMLRPDPIRFETLPEGIRRQWIAPDGRVRIELYPREDLGEMDALERYVTGVRSLAPGAYGEGLVIHEVGRTVVRAFLEALSLAGVLIFALIVLLWRNVRDIALATLPIALAALLTVAATVVLGMPFNFANVIVVPLLVGMGVDSGIHLIHRLRTRPLRDGDLLHTGTSRAVLLSALTTVASFGALGFSSHLGLASLGRLLALGIGLILVCNLGVLTAIVRILERRRGGS